MTASATAAASHFKVASQCFKTKEYAIIRKKFEKISELRGRSFVSFFVSRIWISVGIGWKWLPGCLLELEWCLQEDLLRPRRASESGRQRLPSPDSTPKPPLWPPLCCIPYSVKVKGGAPKPWGGINRAWALTTSISILTASTFDGRYFQRHLWLTIAKHLRFEQFSAEFSAPVVDRVEIFGDRKSAPSAL